MPLSCDPRHLSLLKSEPSPCNRTVWGSKLGDPSHLLSERELGSPRLSLQSRILGYAQPALSTQCPAHGHTLSLDGLQLVKGLEGTSRVSHHDGYF